MENAGRNAAEVLRTLDIRGDVAICCGRGNNGGDGCVIARRLSDLRVPVRVLLCARPEALAEDAAVNFHIIERLGLPIHILADQPINMNSVRDHLAAADWIVDALFGTGLAGPILPPLDA